MRGQGAFILSTSVKTDVTGEALVEILRECRGMERGRLEPEEFEKAASTVKIDFIEALSTVAGTAETLAARSSSSNRFRSVMSLQMAPRPATRPVASRSGNLSYE